MDNAGTPPSLQGQWRGALTDQNGQHGFVVMNLDGAGTRFAGTCYVFENQTGGSGAVYSVRVTAEPEGIRGDGATVAVTDPVNNRLITIAEASAAAPDFTLPMQMSFSASLVDPNRIEVHWSTSVGSRGTAQLARMDPTRFSELHAERVNWVGFKQATTLAIRNHVLFRGQSAPWRLRTSFHRAGRADILKFSTTDIEQLRREISGELNYLFPTHDAQHHTALMALAQHHDYPTPLLDWTRSPYVAAYFACRKIVSGDGTVRPRVYELNLDALAKVAPPAQTILAPLLTMVSLEPLPIHNPRVIPQQSLVTFCNIDDIEEWLADRERQAGEPIIRAFDIVSDPVEVMSDLRLMGIHAGSLFPGLDGVCRSLAERNFMREPEPVDAGDVSSN